MIDGTWRDRLARFVAGARASETAVRAARARGLEPCTVPGEGARPDTNGHTFSWGVCVACEALEPGSRLGPPTYELPLVDAHAILRETTNLDAGPHVRAQRIIESAADFFDVTPDSLRRSSRERQFIRPRHIAMYVIYTDTELSYLEVGRLFRRDHTTVLAACRKITTALKDDVNTVKQVDAVRTRAYAPKTP